MKCLRQASGSPPRLQCPPVVSDEKHHGKWKSHSHKAKISSFDSFPYTSRCEVHNIVYFYETFFFSKQITELWGMDKDRENWRRWIVVRKNRTAMGSEFLSRVHIALIGKDSQGCIGECLTWICADSIHLSIYSGIDFFSLCKCCKLHLSYLYCFTLKRVYILCAIETYRNLHCDGALTDCCVSGQKCIVKVEVVANR